MQCVARGEEEVIVWASGDGGDGGDGGVGVMSTAVLLF